MRDEIILKKNNLESHEEGERARVVHAHGRLTESERHERVDVWNLAKSTNAHGWFTSTDG